MKNYDIAVIGAGPAGLGLALACARRGLATVVIANRLSQKETTVRLRLETLPSTCVAKFEQMGFDAELRKAVEGYCHTRSSSWASADLKESLSLSNPQGPDWIIERGRFDALLLDKTRGTGMPLLTASLGGSDRTGTGWKLRVGPNEIHASFIADASGRASAFALARPAVSKACRYKLVAISAQCTRAENVPMQVLTEAVPGGWWFTAPAGKRAQVVYFTSPGVGGKDLLGARNWTALLEQTVYVKELLSSTVALEGPCARPAAPECLTQTAGDRWLAVGDAACCYDPLSSHGVLHAFETAEIAADAVSNSMSGQGESLHLYNFLLQRHHAEHLAARQRYYAMVQRWPDAVFWREQISCN